MNQALMVFANGILGVFIGMAMLYLTMKGISAIAARFSDEEPTS